MKNRRTTGINGSSRRSFLAAAGGLAALQLQPDEVKAATPTGRDPHKYEEMLPEEFYLELERAPVVYLPIGAMEEHGLRCALAADPWQAYEICLRAARQTGGIVHPIVPIAPAGHPGWSREVLRSGTKDAAAPSVWVSREICKQLYIELLEMFADLGFRFTVAFSGHWPGVIDHCLTAG